MTEVPPEQHSDRECGDDSPMGNGSISPRRPVWTLVRLLVTVALLGVFLYRFSPPNLFEQLGWKLLPISLLGLSLIAVALMLNAARWSLIIWGIGASLAPAQSLVLTLIGHFFSQLLPTSIGGDVVRAWGARETGLRLRDAVSSVLFDRLTGVTALAILIVAGMPYLAVHTDSRLPLVIAVLLISGIAAGIAILVNLHRMPRAWRNLPGCAALVALAGRAGELIRRPGVAAGAVGISLLVHASSLYLTAVIANSLGTKISFIEVLIVVPAVLLLSNLPISIGGWGVREAGFAGGFALLGLPADVAVSTSIFIGVLNLLAALPGGALFVLRWGTRALTSKFDVS